MPSIRRPRSARGPAVGLLFLMALGLGAGSCASALPSPSAQISKELESAERASAAGNERKAYAHLMVARRYAAGVPPSQLLDLAEAFLNVRDYRQAGNLVLSIFQQGTLAPVKGWEPGAEGRERALSLLGKVLFYNSRALMGEVDTPAERARRQEGLAWAESVFRELAGGTGPRSGEAQYYLAMVLGAEGKGGEAIPFRERFLQQVPPKDRRGEMALAAECWRRLSEHRARAEDPAIWPASSEGAPEVTPPVKKYSSAPKYTEPARSARVTGLVILQAIIDPSGKPVCVHPLRGLPMGLTESAIENVSQWRFEPARLEGRSVSVYYNLTVIYRLQ